MRIGGFCVLALVSSAALAAACTTDDDISAPDGAEPWSDHGPTPGTSLGIDDGDDDTPGQVQKVLNHDYQVQQTGYWCGPAATRVALSVRGAAPSQQQLANELPTTVNGTDWIGQVTAVLNDRLGAGTYVTTEMPNDPPTAAQRDRLWRDVVRSIDGDYAIVANIVAPPSNHPPGYPSNQTIYHYFAVVGYNADKREVFIADSAGFSQKQYWLTLDQLATLIPPKGYASVR